MAQAQQVWGNNAGGGADRINAFNPTTGVELKNYLGVNGNGRGVVVVGNIVYYTVVNDPHIYRMNALTGADLGSPLLTSVPSMSTIAYDGKNFWTSDYTGNNNAYEIDPLTGNVIKTIQLGNAGDFYDGLEWFQNKLIANRCDRCSAGIYDVYDLNGNLLTPNFITTGEDATGIAFDGTNFLVSLIGSGRIGIYSAAGAFLQNVDLTPGSYLIEDLSVDYAKRPDVNTAPEPSTIALAGTGLLVMAAVARRRRRV